MIRRIAKELIGKRQNYETVGQYYKRVNRVERKIKDFIYSVVVGIIVAILVVWGILYGLEQEESRGYYAPDYVDENGVLYDTDGDGDMYHWVDGE